VLVVVEVVVLVVVVVVGGVLLVAAGIVAAVGGSAGVTVVGGAAVEDRVIDGETVAGAAESLVSSPLHADRAATSKAATNATLDRFSDGVFESFLDPAFLSIVHLVEHGV